VCQYVLLDRQPAGRQIAAAVKASWHPPRAARNTRQRVSTLLGRWPSIAVLARDIGASYWTVYSWKQRGLIPAEWWDAVIGSAARHSLERIVTYEALAQIAAKTTNQRVRHNVRDSAIRGDQLP